LGSHIGPTRSHTTGRVHSLHFRAVTALFGHAGLEWDVTETTADEREALKGWSDYYKAKRGLIHSGEMVRVERKDEAFVHGVVSGDKKSALFAYATLAAQAGSRPDGIFFAGLDPEKTYTVAAVFPAGKPTMIERTSVSWLEGVKLTGKALMEVGLAAPILYPENALLIEIEES